MKNGMIRFLFLTTKVSNSKRIFLKLPGTSIEDFEQSINKTHFDNRDP
jgi:hypothetical protein